MKLIFVALLLFIIKSEYIGVGAEENLFSNLEICLKNVTDQTVKEELKLFNFRNIYTKKCIMDCILKGTKLFDENGLTDIWSNRGLPAIHVRWCNIKNSPQSDECLHSAKAFKCLFDQYAGFIKKDNKKLLGDDYPKVQYL